MTTRAGALALSLAWVPIAACGGDGGENVGSQCEIADDCFNDVERRDQIEGEIQCLDRVPGGYCTHLCQSDADCCAVEGECDTGNPQVCAPFENSTITRCFLSCEADVIGEMEETEYCQEFAHPDFVCRSTGGGNENRKVCVPNDG